MEREESVRKCFISSNNGFWIPIRRVVDRFVTVDAYNNEGTRRYYEAKGFKHLFSTEQQEKEYLCFPSEKELKTRLMYFDLILLSDKV
jgi:hypothetical protein